MPAAATPDLSKIYRNPVFRSRSSVTSHHELQLALTEHQLRWGRGEVATSLYRRDLQHMSLMILSYGAEVEVTPAPFKDFVLVQMPLRGSVEVESDGLPLRLGPGEVAVLAPRHSLRLLWQPGCEQLIVKLPFHLLRSTAVCSACTSGCASPAPYPAWARPVLQVPPERSAQWLEVLQQMLSLLPPSSQGHLPPSWLGPFEQAAALFLQPPQASAQSPGMAHIGQPLAAHGDVHGHSASSRLARLESYVRSRPFAPLALVDLARAAGVTTRTLNTLCQRHRGISPMGLLRNLRLEGVRDTLLSSQEASVTEVALAHGFGHLGRFSAYYRERFGELPSQTMQRS